mmetsp:Transcript_18921/g.36096  ORF Transcript_18921/g.36096 Transcript_18921/m.36096 type:complete len:222 (+) Transcript_18921:3293-3958(+)
MRACGRVWNWFCGELLGWRVGDGRSGGSLGLGWTTWLDIYHLLIIGLRLVGRLCCEFRRLLADLGPLLGLSQPVAYTLHEVLLGRSYTSHHLRNHGRGEVVRQRWVELLLVCHLGCSQEGHVLALGQGGRLLGVELVHSDWGGAVVIRQRQRVVSLVPRHAVHHVLCNLVGSHCVLLAGLALPQRHAPVLRAADDVATVRADLHLQRVQRALHPREVVADD